MLHGVPRFTTPHDFHGPAGQWNSNPGWQGLLSLFWPGPPLVETGSGGRESHAQ